jgi:peptidoglycan/LPS O-acetylase OafA/YrhL
MNTILEQKQAIHVLAAAEWQNVTSAQDGPLGKDEPACLAVIVRPIQRLSTRNIPSLDGLRAISIILVIASHAHWALTGALSRSAWLNWHYYGVLGVTVFFVISGYLITKLLLKELDTTGSIRLKHFYVRRAFRIFPAFYVYLAFIGVLWSMGLVQQTLGSYIAAFTYTWNYYPYTSGWTLGHVWSLCIEEQFYLCWPLLLLWAGKVRGLRIAICIILLAPFIRVVTYEFAPLMRGHLGMMLHTRIDTLLFGCALAILAQDPVFVGRLQRLCQPLFLGGLLFFVLFVSPVLSARFGGSYDEPIQHTLLGASISLLLFYCIQWPESLVGRVLNLSPMRHLGVISYSVYLWQQIFDGNRPLVQTHYLGLTLLFILLTAEASYWGIERPALRLRRRIEERADQHVLRGNLAVR